MIADRNDGEQPEGGREPVQFAIRAVDFQRRKPGRILDHLPTSPFDASKSRTPANAGLDLPPLGRGLALALCGLGRHVDQTGHE
jgi:hypothetical protein